MFYVGLDLGQRHDPTAIAVVDMLRAARLGCDIAAVTITGGERQTQKGSVWSVPKRDLIAGVQLNAGAGGVETR